MIAPSPSIIPLDSANHRPTCYSRYIEYVGASAADCLKEHDQKYPYYPAQVAYWVEEGHRLFVPAEWRR